MIISNKNQLTKALANVAGHELIRLVYVSKISKATRSDPLLFEHIRLHAEDYNRKNNIKGMLCNDHQYFLQCLEGQKQVVVPLMQRIFDDKRHNKVNIILLKDIKEFIFHDWRMRSFSLDETLWTPNSLQANSPELDEFLPFKPLTWSAWFIEHFLKTMQRFDDPSQNYEADQASYNVIREPQSRMISWFDSGILHWVLFALVVLLLIVLINFNTLF